MSMFLHHKNKRSYSPLQRNAFLFFCCTGIVIYCFGKLSMNTVPSVLIVNNQIGAAALIKLYLLKVRRLFDLETQFLANFKLLE